MSEYSASRERLLDAAEQLFSQRGYAYVKLGDIAKQLKIQQASLYYHVPEGKEALFVEVIERGLKRHHQGLSRAIKESGQQWQDQLRAAAHWFISQPPMNISRMIHSDMPELEQAHQDSLMMEIYESILIPLEQIFVQAQSESKTELPYSGILVGAFLSLIDGIHNAPHPRNNSPFNKPEAAEQIINVFIRGLEPR
jgi:TetR/AcrR family transcriptional regulator, cholesterol catabolism regulator